MTPDSVQSAAPAPTDRRPVRPVRPIGRGPRDVLRSLAGRIDTHRLTHARDLVRELVMRDIKLLYKRSFLGIGWSLLNPVLQLIVFQFVFRSVLTVDVPQYRAYVFSGLLVWQWFQTSLTLATGAVTNNRELVRRPGFRPAVLPAVNVTTGLVHFLLALPVLLVVLLLDRVALSGALVLLPVVIVMQYAMTLGLAYLAATVQVTFRDTQHLLTVLLMLLFYLTPVLYQASAVPGRYQALYAANPMTHLLDAYRALLLRGQPPAGTTLLALGVFAGAALFVGYRVFARASSRFVEDL